MATEFCIKVVKIADVIAAPKSDKEMKHLDKYSISEILEAYILAMCGKIPDYPYSGSLLDSNDVWLEEFNWYLESRDDYEHYYGH